MVMISRLRSKIICQITPLFTYLVIIEGMTEIDDGIGKYAESLLVILNWCQEGEKRDTYM